MVKISRACFLFFKKAPAPWRVPHPPYLAANIFTGRVFEENWARILLSSYSTNITQNSVVAKSSNNQLNCEARLGSTL